MTTAPASDPLAGLRAAVVGATSVFEGEAGERLGLERPPKPELGDYSTNAAMLLAPAADSPPREVAERLRGELEGILGASAERIEVAGPGFINIFLSDRWHREAVSALLEAGERLGAGRPEFPERVLVEFVSANPTGPTTAASGRGAAYGDSLARLLEHSGDSVEREYYINDAGSQVELFAALDRGADERRRSRPRTATPASTWPSSPPSSPPRGLRPTTSRRSRRWPRRRCG